MDLTPSNAQKDIADSVAEYLAAELPIERLRLAMGGDTMVDDGMWTQWASMGFFSLGVPESKGGLGLGLIEEFLMFGQFGSHLTPGPLLSTVLATHLAIDGGGEDDLIGRLLAGEERVGLRTGRIAFDAGPGELVLSVSEKGAFLERVRGLTPVPSVDPTVALAEVEVGEQVAHVDGDALQTRQWILGAAVLLGLAQATTRQSTAYAQVRKQFGKPIGSFQAVKHRCADMLTRCHVAESQLHFAALRVRAGAGDARVQAAAALQLAVDAARQNTAVNIQNHGGIGFTAEHDAGLYLKRAVSVEASLGPATQWQAALQEPTRMEFA
ncbi:acyl-CoA dehydrogenase family protein [Pseudonocardia oroxyli]|uniref:Acyl-CoA dehydrogenase, N-terminal domain n=1 Tax=Pseudonocardia oroxyli TaxID=366584 RepID=A0A1G7TN52_PSEOR|nr:acyl-CoA dehydrogenase family protein [Pseudonocardia oroxyli]SDG36631.1 Acyl-CoA dehydrogenase, N-terminal domain [Pseudonocardia oroxyli]